MGYVQTNFSLQKRLGKWVCVLPVFILGYAKEKAADSGAEKPCTLDILGIQCIVVRFEIMLFMELGIKRGKLDI